jgi:rSAM/selenodomain-associated transferase 1
VSRHLIIFTRYPEPHRTKTRMIPRLGPEGAAELQGDMTDHALAWARELAVGASVSVQVRFEGGDEARMRERFGDSFPYLPQGSGDLGDRMVRAIAEVFAAGAARVIVVGTDCPDITSDLAEEAFERLATADVVLGPATDGGYYLIGLRRPIPALFAGIAWGQETVLRETRKRADELGLATSLLTALSDVDRPEDLPVWQRAKGDSLSASNPPRISVIIPALNEANHLDGTLSALQGAQNIETIVVDGGSCDGTDSLALDRGALLVRSAAGRARQMNAGAQAATGEILLFLHADTRLPERFDEQVPELVARRGVVASAFRPHRRRFVRKRLPTPCDRKATHQKSMATCNVSKKRLKAANTSMTPSASTISASWAPAVRSASNCASVTACGSRLACRARSISAASLGSKATASRLRSNAAICSSPMPSERSATV